MNPDLKNELGKVDKHIFFFNIDKNSKIWWLFWPKSINSLHGLFFLKERKKFVTIYLEPIFHLFFDFRLINLKTIKIYPIWKFYTKIILNFNILRFLNDKPNLKKDLNSALGSRFYLMNFQYSFDKTRSRL